MSVQSSMSATDLGLTTSSRRKVLFAAVSSACYEAGFTSAEKSTLETLTEMLQSFLFEVSRSTRAFCEHSGRTEALPSDVVMALVEMGFDVESLHAYAKRPNRVTLATPSTLPRQTTPRILQAGDKRALPAYIPDHFPPFPDPHTYIRTPTHRQPVTEYETIREKAATQKRDIERALTRFVASTQTKGGHPQQALFPEDPGLFPLVACKPSFNPSVNSLLFTDQVFDEEPAEVPNKPASPIFVNEDAENQKDSTTDSDIMDNPYLRPAKLQRKSKRKS